MAFPPSHSFMFQALSHHHEDHLASTSPSLNSFPSLPPPHHFHQGGGAAPNFMMKRSMSFSGVESNINKSCDMDLLHGGVGDEDLSDDGSQLGEKKKRLNLEQVKALEKSFEIGNKLEPERKVQLAKALGLQPRQVAIWFQNRRARWKTKQLEKEYEILKKKFEAVKADNDALKAHNHKLQAELEALKSSREFCETGIINMSLKKEAEGSWSNNGSDDNSSDNINLDLSRTPTTLMMNNNISPAVSSHNQNQNSLKPNSMTHLLQSSSSRPEHLQDEGFSNMFHNIDEQQHNFWPWPPENHHHFHN